MNWLFAAFFSLVISGCAATQQMTQNLGQPTTEVVSRANKTLIRFNSNSMTGPRRVLLSIDLRTNLPREVEDIAGERVGILRKSATVWPIC